MKEFETAEEFIEEYSRLRNPHSIKITKELMIQFAKYHVDKALNIASGKAMVSVDLADFIEDSWDSGDKIDKQSILTAYSLENIK